MKHAVDIQMETTCAVHIEMEYVAKINNAVPKVKYPLLKILGYSCDLVNHSCNKNKEEKVEYER
jgi:hypothetical protein